MDSSLNLGIEVESSDVEILGDDVVDVDHELKKDQNEIVEPKVGMPFASHEELYDFFKTYARQIGFPVRKRSTNKDKDGVLRWVTFPFACARGGKTNTTFSNRLKPRSNTQTGCKVKITARFELDEKWMISQVMQWRN
ncbi:FAR1 DNA binding domain [Macleaya cordata]|uniref:FAR1 DNA binding domain n=1 Tax=Macleaya cordata TaxID=56857 RepID=A0A200PQ41_MACCD|nr:FAR1 DNA binding domain [Macleaya cordata]